jgi:hypothetical protein
VEKTMAEYPKDVLAKSNRLWEEALADGTPDAAFIIAQALMEEREKAARIAEREGVYPELNVFAGGPEWYQHGKRIAAAIRSGGE